LKVINLFSVKNRFGLKIAEQNVDSKPNSSRRHLATNYPECQDSKKQEEQKFTNPAEPEIRVKICTVEADPPRRRPEQVAGCRRRRSTSKFPRTRRRRAIPRSTSVSVPEAVIRWASAV
jgi:hypothetical protein